VNVLGSNRAHHDERAHFLVKNSQKGLNGEKKLVKNTAKMTQEHQLWNASILKSLDIASHAVVLKNAEGGINFSD